MIKAVRESGVCDHLWGLRWSEELKVFFFGEKTEVGALGRGSTELTHGADPATSLPVQGDSEQTCPLKGSLDVRSVQHPLSLPCHWLDHPGKS